VAGCWLKNEIGNTPTYWNGRTGWQISGSGAVSGTSPVLTSIPAGGDWLLPATWQENAGGGAKVPTGAYDVIITENVVTVNPTAVNIGKCHNLLINSGGRLTLPIGKGLNVGGLFTIESSGSFIDENLTNTLSATVKRSITGNYPGSGPPSSSTIWHYVSSPTTNATIGTFLGCLLNKWTEGSTIYGGYWDTLYLPLTLPLEVGRGYSVASFPTFGNAVFSGPLNTGNITKGGLTNTNPSNIYYGFHLLGNPYPSAFKWNDAITKSNVDGAIYLWNGSTYISKIPADNYEVQAEQGFFVHASASGGSVMIPNSNRIHSSGSYLKSNIENQLTITVNGNTYSDETSVRFNDMATTGFDGEYDAYKLSGIYSCPQIFSILPEFNLSINSLPDINTQSIIQLGFKSGIAGSFTLTASGIESFISGTNFYLTDLFTGNVQNLSMNPIYSFSASPSNSEHRFDLTFSPVGLNESNNYFNIKLYYFEKNIFVNVPSGLDGDITVYDLLGNEIAKKAVESNSLNKIELTAAQGYYLVKVVTNKVTVTEKVFIR
jgi:hypothetical protein